MNRSQSLQEAETVFEIDPSHLMTISLIWENGKKSYLFYIDNINFQLTEFYLVSNKNPKKYDRLPIPADAQLLDVYQNTALIHLNSDWQVDEETLFKQNSLIGMDLKKFRKNPKSEARTLNLRLWYEADNHSKIESVFCNEDNAYIFVLNNLCMQMFCLIPSLKSIRLQAIPIPIDYSYAEPLFINEEGEILFHFETFMQPKKLYAYNPFDNSLKLLHQGSRYFDETRYFVRRLGVKSKDGVTIPYHLVAKKGLILNGLNPTILKGYGGFTDYLNPNYLALRATALLEKGFIYVHAHVRGGGEFGEQWHHMGSVKNKQNCFDDFIAVAEDLITQKITSADYLGIQGASNGGLLVAACATQRPELFGAVFCDVAVLDMLRYHKLFVGRSWIQEYGDPTDPAMHQMLAEYSPLHNLKAEKKYPKMFFQTSTTDDRVHPCHAREMAYQLQKLNKPAFFFEKKEGGHTGSSFEECMRIYTYWHLRLLVPAERERKRLREENSDNKTGFFQTRERQAPHRRLEKEKTAEAEARFL